MAIRPASPTARAEGLPAPVIVGERAAVAEQHCRLAGFRLVSGTYLIAPQFWRDDIDESLVALEWPARHVVNADRTVACWTLRKAADDLPIVEVPTLVGLPRNRCLELLRTAGLVAMEADAAGDDPIVVQCFPEAGAAVYQGTAVCLRTARNAPAPGTKSNDVSAALVSSAPSEAKIVTPEPTVDWETGTVTVVIPLELPAGQATLRLAAADDAEQGNLTLKRVERGLAVSGSVTALRAVLEPGTRSLPIDVATSKPAKDGEGNDDAPTIVRYRADLPAIDIVKASKDVADGSSGPTLRLWIKGLTPDFTIDGALVEEPATAGADGAGGAITTDGGEATSGIYRPLVIGPGENCDARIAFVDPDEGLGVRVSLEFSGLPPGMERRCRLAVVDGFGSRTRTLELRQEGFDIVGNLHAYLPALAAPVDEFVAVPRMELLEYAEAAKQAREAGFVPVVRSPARQAYSDVKADDARLVVAQGIAGGRGLRRGEMLLLALEGEAEASSIADPAIGRGASAAGDPFGFVAVPERRSMTHDGYEAVDDEEGAQIAGGHALASAPSEAAPAGEPNEVRPVPLDEGTLPLAAGAWVPLDPRLDPADVEGRASMKAIVDAVSSRLDGEEPPGVAGRLLGDVVREYEDDLTGLGSKPGGLETAVGAITDQVAERLQVDLPADERSRLVAACAAAHAGQTPSGSTGGASADPNSGASTDIDAVRHELDRNGNGFAADDIVAWILAQLLADKHLPPTALGQVVPGALGTPVAVLTSQPSKPAAGGKPMEPTVTVVDEEILIPAGKPSESAETSPTKVRVPPLEDARMLPSYLARLKSVGLVHAKDGKFFEKDKVLSASPAEKEWVAPTTPIKLELERLVPDVTKLGAKEAVEALHEKDFKVGLADPDRKYRNDDRVVAQSPETGAYRPPSTKVDLTIKRPVPKVVGSKLSDAVALLRSREFGIRIPETRLETDVVAEQSPAAGTPADIGSDVTFLRLETTMPDLAGASIAQAKTLKQAQEILGERALKYSLAEPKSDYAQAKVVAQAPKFGAKIDREKETAELKLVIPVPEVAEPVTLAKAIGSLRTFTLGYAVTSGKAQDDDYVMELDVAQGERRFASGGKSYVYPGAKMVLKIGRPVPRVDEREWESGLAAVREKGFDVSTPLGSGTHVHSTEPIGGKLADLRYPVRVKAGIKVPSVDGLPWAAAERVLDEVDLGLRASTTTEVETDESSKFNTLWVATDAGQTPAAGRIILKRSVQEVSVRALRYVERRAIVPDVVGLDPSEAGRRVVRAELREQFTRFDQPTADERLANTEEVASQEPSAGTKLKKGSQVLLRIRKYVYQAPLTTYAARTGGEIDYLLTCVLSADRRTITVTNSRLDGQGASETVRGTLIDDTAVFQNKRCLTYELNLLRVRSGLRIPFDGIGGGESLDDGVWRHVIPGMNPLRFDLQKPNFR